MLTSEESTLLLVFFSFGKKKAFSNNLAKEARKGSRLYEVVAMSMQYSFEASKTVHYKRLLVAEGQVSNERGVGPLPAPFLI